MATLRTDLCVFGEDPSGHLPRTPVAIRIAVSSRLQTILDIKVFATPLAQQRFELVRDVRPDPSLCASGPPYKAQCGALDVHVLFNTHSVLCGHEALRCAPPE